MTASRSLDVLVFGEAIVDFFPSEAGLPLAQVATFHRHLGGAPANVAVALARLGVASGLMTLVGPDDFGRFAREELLREGVDARGVGVHRTARTGITFVAVGPRGERSFSFYRHESADQLIAPSDVDGALVAEARAFHFGSSTLARDPARRATLAALADARDAGCLVSSDPNFRPHLWAAPAEAPCMIRQALAECDLVKLSDDELAPLLGTTDVEAAAVALGELGVRLAVITLGARGCYFRTAAHQGYVSGERVDVVDTTGAGDGFTAGLLAQLMPAVREGRALESLPREELARACAFANRVGARTVTRLGAQTALPRRGEVV